MPLYLVIASASTLVEADSAEEAREQIDSCGGGLADWDYEIDDVQEYDEGPDLVLRPKK